MATKIKKVELGLSGVTREDLIKLIIDLEEVLVQGVDKETGRKANVKMRVDAGEAKVSKPFKKNELEYRFDVRFHIRIRNKRMYNLLGSVHICMPAGNGEMDFNLYA